VLVGETGGVFSSSILYILWISPSLKGGSLHHNKDGQALVLPNHKQSLCQNPLGLVYTHGVVGSLVQQSIGPVTERLLVSNP
jgi:hypothetical protein